MSDELFPGGGSILEPAQSYAPNPAIPQCSCQCHNREVANVVAELDVDGHYHPEGPGEAEFWRGSPRFVDRRDEVEAAFACTSCKGLHALAYSSDPAKAWEDERRARALPHPPAEPVERSNKGGPQGQCEPGCPYCRQLDSIKEDHKH